MRCLANPCRATANAAVWLDKQDQAKGYYQQETEYKDRQSDGFMKVIPPAGFATFDDCTDSTLTVDRFRANVLCL